MVTHQEIERQLRATGTKIGWFGRAEARELEHIIEPGETIMYCLNGRYENGFAMLCVTNHRVVLIDKKPLYLSIEDIRYDMVSEVDFDGRLLESTVTICTLSKNLRFSSFKGAKLRYAMSYLQRKVMASRQQGNIGQLLQKTQPNDIGVNSLEHRITNPYAKIPLAMRRRVSRYYS